MIKSVTLTEEDFERAREIQDDPDKILALVDWMFLGAGNCKTPS